MQSKLAASRPAPTTPWWSSPAPTRAASTTSTRRSPGARPTSRPAPTLFIEAPRTVEELALVGRELAGVPLVVNVVEGGKTPELDLKEYADLGFGVVLFANYLMRSMMLAGSDALAHLAAHGETRTRADRMATWAERQALVNLPEFTAAEARSTGPGRRPMIPGLPYATELPDRVGVLVLGSGLAGCAALLAAAEAGQFAVMLEKTSEIGGSTVKSAGLSAFAGTTSRSPRASPTRSSCCARTCSRSGVTATTSAWSTSTASTSSTPTPGSSGTASGTARCTPPRGSPPPLPPDRHHRDAGAPAQGRRAPRCPAGAGRPGPAAGPRGRPRGRRRRPDPDGVRRVLADAVVVATGGFSQSPELLERFAPQMEHALRAGGERAATATAC